MTLGLQDLPSKDFPTGTPMPNLKKPTLDKDLDKLSYMEEAAGSLGRGLIAPGIALVFIVLCALGAGASMSGAPGTVIIVAAAAIGAIWHSISVPTMLPTMLAPPSVRGR